MIRYIFVVFILCSGTHSGQFPNRIYHGKQVDNNIQYKFTVEIKMLGDHFCGGSLISLKNVLTAAHCFVKLKEYGLDSFKVYAGIIDNTDNTNQRSIADLCIHKDYRKPDNFSNDIALLDLDVPFDRDTRGTQIIQIAPQEFAWPAGDEGTVFGWGLMQNNTLARYLMHTNITLINKIQCKRLLMARGLEEQFDDMMECSLDPDGAKDACSADSGGPMVHLKTGYLIGIVSWGIGCGVKSNPGVYMSVACYHDWIKEHTGVE